MEKGIKFRGKGIHTLNMGKWLYGNYCRFTEWAGIYAYHIILEIYTEQSYYNYLVDENTVGQYIGLTDRNGKEIYEGDIVRFEGTQSKPWTAVVRYHHESAAFLLDRKVSSRGIDGSLSMRLTVIGNIYDNPELAKEIIG